jgi:hypothetical protein
MTLKFLSTIVPLLNSTFDVRVTMQQLTYGNKNLIRFRSWGVSGFNNVRNKGLVLKVDARKHKSYVLITYDRGKDVYSFHLVSSHGKIIKSLQDVYFDVLNEAIDNEIERIPENFFKKLFS